MSNRNQLRVLAASLACTAAITLAGAWWIKQNVFQSGDLVQSGLSIFSPKASNEGKRAIAGRDGTSGVSIFAGNVPVAKQQGLNAMANEEFGAAVLAFSTALEAQRNDPETLIYLNNAKIGLNEAYTIAAVVPANPKLADTSMEILRGVAQAQDSLNQSLGIGGTLLKVLVIDDQDSPERATEIAIALAANPDVLGVVGHFSSSTTLQAAKIYEANRLPVISPTSTASEVTRAGDYTFRTVPSDRFAAASLAKHMLGTLNQQRAAVFYTGGDDYSESLRSEFAAELTSEGGSVVAEFDTNELGFEASKAITNAQRQGAEVIMLSLLVNDTDIPIEIMSANRGRLPMMAGDDLYSQTILRNGNENALGMVVAVPWAILNHRQSPFVLSAQQLWGGDVNWRTVTAYDAVMALAAGIEQSVASENSTEDSLREEIAETLSSPDFMASGATEDVRFFSNGDRNQPSQLVIVKKSDRNSSGYEFAPVEP